MLKEGNVVLLPTDTAYGLSCRIDSPDSINRILDIKKRDAAQSMIVLVSDKEMLQKYVTGFSEDVERKILDRYWPGMLTVILPCRTDLVSPLVRGERATLALRMPAVSELREIIMRVGVPIVSTSANLHGEKTPFELSDVDARIKEQVDYIFPEAFTHASASSTILDCTQSPWRILREGAVQLDI